MLMKMTINECLLDFLPEMLAAAENEQEEATADLCRRLLASGDARLAFWRVMVVWCAEFDGVAQHLQRAVSRLLDEPEAEFDVDDVSTIH